VCVGKVHRTSSLYVENLSEFHVKNEGYYFDKMKKIGVVVFENGGDSISYR